MTTTTVITNAEYKQNIAGKVGTLMFSDDYYDATHYVDVSKVRKQFGLKGKIKIMITTDSHPEFKNIANKDIPYKHRMCASHDYDGAYLVTDGRFGQYYAMDYPVGDAYIVN